MNNIITKIDSLFKIIRKNYIFKNSSSFLIVFFISLIILSLFLNNSNFNDKADVVESNNTIVSEEIGLNVSNREDIKKDTENDHIFQKNVKSSNDEITNRTGTIEKYVDLKHDFTIEKIFDGILEQDENTWTLVVTGDIMLGRTVNTRTNRYNDFTWSFKNINNLLQNSDITFINLESPLTENCNPIDSGMIFCGDLEHTIGIKNAGVDIVSFANNHALNQGKSGVKQTVDALNEKGILVTGVENPNYYELDGFRIAFLAFDDVECYSGIECATTTNIINDLNVAKSNSDLVIVMYSWGNEYTYNPTNRQKELAYLSIDNGADLVLGNHPHWYQPVEIYKDKLIVYSHGNTIFDQMWSRNTREGLIGKYIFNKDNLIDAEFIPIMIYDYGQPLIVTGEDRNYILNNFERISQTK